MSQLSIKYAYIGTEPIEKDIDSLLFHQISPEIINNYLTLKQSSLTTSNVVRLLEKDNAYFDASNIRYYNSETKTFWKLCPSTDISSIIKESSQLRLMLYRSCCETCNSKLREFEKRIVALEDELQLNKSPSLAKMSPQMLPISRRLSDRLPSDGTLSVRHSLQPSLFSTERKIDLVIMYAEPLTPSMEPVYYERECSRIVRDLKAKNKRIDILIEIATRKTLAYVLSRGPVILHILCHGTFDKQKEEFCLCFEGLDGELDLIGTSDIKSMMKGRKIDIKLVFTNTCHSEAVAKVFKEAGVPCVVGVKAETKIWEPIAQTFAQTFYSNIFDGSNLGEAFRNAKEASSSTQSLNCCCAHDHKDFCVWYKKYKVNMFEAHRKHCSNCTSCKNKFAHKHRLGCQWASLFINEFGTEGHQDYEEPFYDAENGEISTCCCSPEIPHDEALKFLKIADHPKETDQIILFPAIESGVLTNHSNYNILEQKFPVNNLIGRNNDLQKLYEALTPQSDHRFVVLKGKRGTGKSVLAKQIANYLYARGYYRDNIIIIKMEIFQSISEFLVELARNTIFDDIDLTGDIQIDLKKIFEPIKHKEILVILEDCDAFIANNKEPFSSKLRQLASDTKYMKFLMVCQEDLQLNLHEAVITLSNMKKIDAAQLLLSITPTDCLPYLMRDIDQLISSCIFQKNPSFAPQTIWWISQKLREHRTFEEIDREMEKIKNSGSLTDEEGVQQTIFQALRYIIESFLLTSSSFHTK